ncbi:MAG: SpoIIE family protein phosphatase, partial [Oscillospiraceae bacterium]|nr:SpoIIE family protein phosphatase [Oscillospiraceae bacterium]
PVAHRDSYSAFLYNNTNGLPTSEANTIVQTSEGSIWIGSYGGLIRYDGNTFEQIDPRTGINSVKCLYVDYRDYLWIGTNDSGLAMMHRGQIHFWHESDGLGAAKVNAIAEDADGNIYVCSKGMVIITPDLTLHPVDDPLIANAYVDSIKQGADGLLYCTTYEDDVFTIRNGEVVDYYDHRQTGIDGISSILPDRNDPGMLYIGAEGSALYHCGLKTSSNTEEYTDISPLSGVNAIEQIGDKIWICCLNGIGVLDEEGFHYLEDLPMNDSVVQVIADYEGNLWFTSTRRGVMKLVANRFTDLFRHFHLSDRVVNTTCIYEDKLFVGTDTGLLILDEYGPLSEFPLAEVRTAAGKELKAGDLLTLLDGTRIRSVTRDSENRLWIATTRSMGLLRYDRGKITIFSADDGLFSNQTRIVHETADGSFLVVCTGGMNVIKEDRVIGAYGQADGISNPENLSVCTAPNGDILLGSNGDGVYIINKQGIRCITTHDGLSSGVVMRIKYDAAREVFWLITGNAIATLTTDYQVRVISRFPYANNFDLYENSQGYMWVLSGSGIYVVPAEELLANEEINPVHFGIANGLPFITTSNSYSERTDEGDLYIAGNSGVVKVNIDAPTEEIDDLKMSISYVDADGVRFYPDDQGAFVIPSSVRKLTIYGFVYNYSLNDPQVSWYLKGFDMEPITVRHSELDPVTYTNLRGGSYRFVVELKDAKGQNSKQVWADIIKEKALYEKDWFYLLIGVGLLVLIITANHFYVRHRMQILEKKQKEEAERERINKELELAKRIQLSMLPSTFPPFPDHKEFELFAAMRPAREVGGDFYDFFLVDNDHLALVIADVSGKSIPAALFMMNVKSMIKGQLMSGCDPAQALFRVNQNICGENQSMMFVTVWLAVLKLSTGEVLACNAGHENPGFRP